MRTHKDLEAVIKVRNIALMKLSKRIGEASNVLAYGRVGCQESIDEGGNDCTTVLSGSKRF
jgi:hypothetical protein